MKKLSFPSVYCIRSPNTRDLMFRLINRWAKREELEDFPALCWLTSLKAAQVYDGIKPALGSKASRLKGLDIITVEPEDSSLQVRSLARMLGQVCPIRPAVVFVDNLGLWLNEQNWKLQKLDVFQQIQQLGNWCDKNRITLVALAEDQLPTWSSLANGLEDVDENGESHLTHWWHYSWGYAGSLWNFGGRPGPSDDQLLLDSSRFSTLGHLAREVYRLRFGANEALWLHVRLRHHAREVITPALLRLGADTVYEHEEGWLKHFHGSTSCAIGPKGRPKAPTEPVEIQDFGSTLQEILTPGLLTFVGAAEFAAQGHLLINQAAAWGMHCSLSRLSLLKHVSAMQACKLTDLLNLRACGLATQEALYFFRLCDDEVDSADLDEWLKDRFIGPMHSLFAGVSHYTNTAAVQSMLNSLHNYEVVVLGTDLTESDDQGKASQISDLWTAETLSKQSRPWLERVSALSGLSNRQSVPSNPLKET